MVGSRAAIRVDFFSEILFFQTRDGKGGFGGDFGCF